MYNIFSEFLKELNVAFVTSYANDYYNNHPYKNTLYGISDLLYKYNIPNVGVKVDNCESLSLCTPFIAHIEDDFIIVKEISFGDIKYIWEG